MRTQKQIVLDLLIVRGETGVSAREAIYDLHITRLAAIIFDLRQDGYLIKSETKKGETARYQIVPPSAGQARARLVCGCGHPYRQHVSGMTCMAESSIEIMDRPVYCACQKFTERKEAS